MLTSEPSLALFKVKESSATTLLIGVISAWILVTSSSIPLSDKDEKHGSIVYRDGFTCEGSSKGSTIISTLAQTAYVPKTALVKKLMELRKAAMVHGMNLITADEINKEVETRRGNRV